MILFALIQKTGYITSFKKSTHLYTYLNTPSQTNHDRYFAIAVHPQHKQNTPYIKSALNPILLLTVPSLRQCKYVLQRDVSIVTLLLIVSLLSVSQLLFKTIEADISKAETHLPILTDYIHHFKKQQSEVDNNHFNTLVELENDYSIYYMHATLQEFILSIIIPKNTHPETYISNISAKFPTYKCMLYSTTPLKNIITIYGVSHDIN